ncbi:leucyl/phenylalanyl-tRNA--protein transferase [Robiginitalea sp.]|nr:leucyl/phenylalanyl-tRNA--protein transferase [Robiginitalea sp.]
MQNPIPFLDASLSFPDPNKAGPQGLLAAGGDLSPERLLLAYQSGIFPWFNEDSLILWWSPDPRMVLFPEELRISKSMKKIIEKKTYTITRNQCFNDVISSCAETPRRGETGTWITPNMQNAYADLHQMGYAVSYETWHNNDLVGGLYGIELGGVFCGESMFSKMPNASKQAFIYMVQEQHSQGCRLIDCQVHTAHLESLGARPIARGEFLKLLLNANEKSNSRS